MFIRITGAPVEIRTTQILKVRRVTSVISPGTPGIYWLNLHMRGSTNYPSVCLLFYFAVCSFMVYILTSSVA
jgi:hypothetical protein